MKPKSCHEYVVGVITMDVEGKDSERFLDCSTKAVSTFEHKLKASLGVRVVTLSFEGPHLTPTAGAGMLQARITFLIRRQSFDVRPDRIL